jgi:hypothetical protein
MPGLWPCRTPSRRSPNSRRVARWLRRMRSSLSAVFPFEVRHLLYGRRPHVYRILFTIEDLTVYVLHIRHGRRQPLKR